MSTILLRDALILTGDPAATAYQRGYLLVDGEKIAALYICESVKF